MSVSPQAYVHPSAKIGQGSQIEPFAYLGADVELGTDCWIAPHATLLPGARIGNGCKIFPGAVIAAIPQDKKFAGEYSTAELGDGTVVRESATVNRGTKSRSITRVGQDCLIMAYSHVAHDCILGNHIIIGNASQVAGEVEIDDYANLSGGVLVHQFTRIGRHVMIQGGSKVNKDVPPFVMAGREPLAYMGLNVIGLRRHGFTQSQILILQEAYRLLYREGLNFSQGIERIVSDLQLTAESQAVIDFVRGSSRGIIRGPKYES